MTLMRAATVSGYVLTYDTDDVEDLKVETPNDITSEPRTDENGFGYLRRELGQAHLVVRVDFKEGKRALWVDQADAALPDLRSASRFLAAALDAEDVPAELASRIYNRFFYGDPRGLVADEKGSGDE